MPTDQPIEHRKILATTQSWVEKAVIGLNFCPFAKAVHVKNQIRYLVSDATTPEALLGELVNELTFLDESDPLQVETTVLIHPYVLTDFLDYNDFLDVADAALEDLDLIGIIQIASFHPQYQFAGTAVDDIENFTNRSPYPVLHLLREASIERAVEAFPDASQIFEKNIETLHRIGRAGWDSLEINNVEADSNDSCVKNTTSEK
ncbi:MAG: DUF1415 domain-containing protein [Burkholderiaceae bacterium]